MEVEWKLSGEAEKVSVALRCTIWGTASLLGTLTVPAAPWEYESSNETMRRHHLKDADADDFQLAALPWKVQGTSWFLPGSCPDEAFGRSRNDTRDPRGRCRSRAADVFIALEHALAMLRV